MVEFGNWNERLHSQKMNEAQVVQYVRVAVDSTTTPSDTQTHFGMLVNALTIARVNFHS